MDKERQIYQQNKENNDKLVKAISEKKPFTLNINGEAVKSVEIKGPKGEPGTPGKDGSTPIKGVDYFTMEEQSEIVDKILKTIKVPKDGSNGKDAVVDYAKIQDFIKREVAKIPKPKNGVDGINPVIDYDSVIKEVTKNIPEIDYKTIYENIGKEVERIERSRPRQLQSAGPSMHLADINDVNVDGITTGQVLSWNGTNWVATTVSGGGAVDSVNGQTGVVVLTKSDIGLGNVDNTSDLNKPVSTATQTALDAKEDDLTFSTGLTRVTNTITAKLSTGVAGGQSVVGGTASGNNLTLSSTSNATKGSIILGTSAYDELNNRLGIGTASPTRCLELIDASNPQFRLAQAAGSVFADLQVDSSHNLHITQSGNGQIISGGGGFTYSTIASGKGSIILNNGNTDSPNIKFAYGNATNFGVDTSTFGTFGTLSGQFFRFIKQADETGGAVVGGFDLSGTLSFLGSGYFGGTLDIGGATDTTLSRISAGVVGVEGVALASIESPAFTGNPTAPTPTTTDNDTSIATTAFVQSNKVGYVMHLTHGAVNPVDASTYYWGVSPTIANTVSSDGLRVYIPKSGTIKAIYMEAFVSGTLGTTENAQMYLRLNNTTDITISTTLSYNVAHQLVTPTISQAVTAGDYICIKFVTPTWVTNPISVIHNITMYIE